MSMINEGFSRFFSAVTNVVLHNMAENEEVEFPEIGHLVVREFNIYTLLSCVKKTTFLWIC